MSEERNVPRGFFWGEMTLSTRRGKKEVIGEEKGQYASQKGVVEDPHAPRGDANTGGTKRIFICSL